jgi:signal transduction histidine kinase
MNYRHSKIHLQLLGEVVGAAYSQHKVVDRYKQAEEKERKVKVMRKRIEMTRGELDEQAERGAKTAGDYAIQSLHRLTNVTQAIYSCYLLTRNAKSEKESRDGFNDLDKAILVAMRIVESFRKTSRRTMFPYPRKCRLVDLINQALKEIDEFDADKLRDIDIKLISLDDLIVKVDPQLTKEVFFNLIDNAANAMKGEKKRELTIALKAVNTKSVEVSIKDTGKGMTNKERQAAWGGFITTQDYKGIGVLISRRMLDAQGGALGYSRDGSQGTEAIVTLPLEEVEATL